MTAPSPFQMVLHEGRHRADLDGVGVIGRVLKQAIVRVEELLGEQEEELSRRTTVVQSGERRGINNIAVHSLPIHT